MVRVVAVDAHKLTFTFVVREGRRRLQGPSRRRNTEEEVRSLARRFAGATVVVEACGPHEWMHDVLLEEGAVPFVCRPPRRDDNQDKSDRNDADLLGRDFLADRLTRVWIPPPAIRLLREVVRERFFLVGQRTALTNRVKHELIRWNVPTAAFEGDRERVLRKLPHLASAYAILEALDGEIETLTRRVREEGDQIQAVRRLRTIPGFGDVVALAYYVELGDVSRFPSAEDVSKYVGLAPKWRASGESRIDLHRLGKSGRPLLSAMLNQAAWVHVRCAPESAITQDYERFLRRGMNKRTAICAVERKLSETAYSVWKNDRDFTMTRPATSAACRP